jgi:NAD/NADP transhydrogenase alpha subunit
LPTTSCLHFLTVLVGFVALPAAANATDIGHGIAGVTLRMGGGEPKRKSGANGVRKDLSFST